MERHYDRKLNDELRFDEVNLVVVDRAARLFVVDTTNRLFVLDRDGTLLHTFAASAPGAGDIEFGPFVIDDDGRIYLTRPLRHHGGAADHRPAGGPALATANRVAGRLPPNPREHLQRPSRERRGVVTNGCTVDV
jgi:sugar lactone lactonase YvrE